MTGRLRRVAALGLAAGLALAAGVPAQTPPRASPGPSAPARAIDDSRARQLLEQAQGGLQRGDFAAAAAAGAALLEENARLFGSEHPNVAVAHNVLGYVFLRLGRFDDADAQFRRMLEISERRLGPEHEFTASALNGLALVLERQGDNAGAESLLRRALAILEKVHGRQHADTATTLSNLGRVLDNQGKSAANAATSAAPGRGSAVGEDDPAQLAIRAERAARRGQLQEAESLHERALAIHEKTLGAEHPTTATSISNLGNVLFLQGRHADAEKVYRRVLALREQVLGPQHADVATSLNNLATALQELGQDQSIGTAEARARARAGGGLGAVSEVEALYRRALAVQEQALGREHPDTARTRNNLGVMYALRGDYAQSEALHRDALATMEKVFGVQHSETAGALTALSFALDRQAKLVEAEASYRRAVEVSRRGGNPRSLLINASRLGAMLSTRGRFREALPFFRESVDVLDFLYAQTRGYSEETRTAFLSQFSAVYRETIRVLIRLHRIDPQGGHAREALAVASRNQSRVFSEMMRQADVARFAGDPAFVQLREERERLQERVAQLRQLKATIPATLADAARRAAELDAQMAQGGRDLAGLEQRLWRDYPRYMELANPQPVGVADLQQKILRPDEALVSYVLLPQETVIFAATRTDFRMVVSPVRRGSIADRVHRVRRAIEKVALGESVLVLRDIDAALLRGLHADLVAPVGDLIAGRRQVFIVADGPLHTVPFEFLVTRHDAADRDAFEARRAASDGSAARPFLGEYAELNYLGREARFAYLPSLSALSSQRLYPKRPAAASLELVAFADPVFTPGPSMRMSEDTVRALSHLNVGAMRATDGSPVIPRLADTADEAKEIASVLGGRSELHVGVNAQERVAKSGGLRDARFVLFATHGFLGGEFVASDLPPEEADGRRAARRSSGQPSLALTLVGDLKGEDGLLTMKEVIEDLELNAELVALSACNTAGETAEANNGEGFAGLTRAFMYAGARSLLVSHWSVDSASTQALMTDTFRNIRRGTPVIAAVSDARQKLRQDSYRSGDFHFSRAHPFFWAPFVYVGD